MSTATVIDRLSPTGFEILKALAQYRFLTTRQMLAMGIVRDRGYLGQVLASLLSANRQDTTGERKPKEIGELDFGVKVGKGRLPRMYFLTKRGAALLEELEPDIAPVRFPARVVRFAPDYEHRVSCVDFQITLDAWAHATNRTVIGFRQYFDWSKATAGNQPAPATRLQLDHKRIDADALFLLRDPSGIERQFVFEMANGIDTGRVLQKMEHLAKGLGDGSLNRALSFPADEAVRILFVFEYRRTAELVASRADSFPHLRQFAPHFLLKPLEDLSADTFRQDWMSLDPEATPRPLF